MWKKARKEKSAGRIEGGNIIIKIEGDNNTITIPRQVHELSKNAKVVDALKTIARPVADENGIEDAKIIYKGKEETTIDRETAKALRDIHADTDVSVPQIFTAHIRVHGPILDAKAKKWKFKLNQFRAILIKSMYTIK